MRHHAIYFSERGYIGAEITYRSIDLDGINGKDLVADASDAMRTLAALPEVDASKIGVIGDSAGGHLALCLALAEDETLHPAVVFCLQSRHRLYGGSVAHSRRHRTPPRHFAD